MMENLNIKKEEEADEIQVDESLNQFGEFLKDIKCEIDNNLFQISQSEATTSSVGARKRKTLKGALAGLMGEANMKYASGDLNSAINSCTEVIKYAPDCPEPFRLLSIIYEEKEQHEKSLQYRLVGAYLTKTSVDEWLSVANKCVEMSNYTVAHLCYDKICRLDPGNIQMWTAKCEMMKKANCDKKKILECYSHMLPILESQDSDHFMNLTRLLFNEYISIKEIGKARNILWKGLSSKPSLSSHSDINLLIEAMFMLDDFQTPLEVLNKLAGVQIDSSSQVITFKNELPVDLVAKLLVTLINQEMMTLATQVLPMLRKESCEEVGDLFLDVTDALMKKKDFSTAEDLLQNLVKSKNYNLAAVWLRYGECLKIQNKLPQASEVYSKVVTMAPNHMEARVTLSTIWHKLGEVEKSLSVLNSSMDLEASSEADLKVLIIFCLNLSKPLDFIPFGLKVLRMCAQQVLTEKHRSEILNSRVIRLRRLIFHYATSKNFQPFSPPSTELNIQPLSQQIWMLFEKLLDNLKTLKRHEDLHQAVILALLCPAFFQSTQKSLQLEYICLLVGFLNKTTHFSYYVLRNLLIKEPADNKLWNLFSQMLFFSPNSRYNKFCLRLFQKNPSLQPLTLLTAHNSLVASSYKQALSDYFVCLKQDSRNPLIHLMIAITYLHITCQRFTSHRHMLTTQSLSFLNHYLSLRGPCQEVFYNIGRSFHQLGLSSQALSFYKTALSLPSSPEPLDLRREIAFNMHLIYLESKSPELAKKVLIENIVI